MPRVVITGQQKHQDLGGDPLRGKLKDMHFCAGPSVTCQIRLYGNCLAAADSFALLGRHFCTPANDREPLLPMFRLNRDTYKVNWLRRLKTALSTRDWCPPKSGKYTNTKGKLQSSPGTAPQTSRHIFLNRKSQKKRSMWPPEFLASTPCFTVPAPSNEN